MVINFIHLVSLVIVLVALYSAVKYRKLNHLFKPFCWFVFLSAIIEVLSKALFLQSINNLPLLHLYVAGGVPLLALFYERILDGFISKNIIRALSAVFLLLTITNSLFIQPLFTFNSNALIVASIFIVILALATYMALRNDAVKQRHQPIAVSINWINLGLFIYYSCVLLVFLLQSFLDTERPFSFSKQITYQTWVLHGLFTMVMYLCFLVGLWKARPAEKKE